MAPDEIMLSSLTFAGFTLVGWALLMLDRTLIPPPPTDTLGDVQVLFLLCATIISLFALWAVNVRLAELLVEMQSLHEHPFNKPLIDHSLRAQSVQHTASCS